MNYYSFIRDTLIKAGVKFGDNKCLNLSEENFKTHIFVEYDVYQNICEKCGMKIEKIEPYFISLEDLSCVEYTIKNIIE